MAEATDDPFEAEAARRAAARDPFEVEYARRQQARTPPASAVSDIGWQLPQGINSGVDMLVNLPYNIVRGGAHLAGIDLPEAKPILGHFNSGRPAETTAGRYAHSAGEVLGSSILPEAALLSKASTLAKLAPTTTARALGQTLGETVASAPGRAVAADVIASGGAGVGQEAAHDMGFGPVGQTVGGMLGAMTPVAGMVAANRAMDITRQARASANPYERFTKGLGDASLDDLSNAVAVGNTNSNLGNSRYALDVLGEEMARAGGDTQAAFRSTINRIADKVVVPEAADRITRQMVKDLRDGKNPFPQGTPPEEIDNFIRVAVNGEQAPVGNLPFPTISAAIESQARAKSIDTAADHLRRVTQAHGENQLLLGEYPSVARSDLETRVARSRNPASVTDEAAAARQESGVQDLMDYVANTGTMASSQNVRNALRERAGTLTENAEHTVQALSPNGQTIQDVEQMMGQARRLAGQEYDAAHSGTINYPMLHGLLQRSVDRALSRVAGRSGDQADALNTAVERFFNTRPAGTAARDALPGLQDDLAAARGAVREARRQQADKATIDNLSRRAEQIAEDLRLTRRDATPPTQQYLMPTLQQAQDARSALRGQITAAREADRADLVQMLQPLYNQATYAMRRASPQWAAANRRWADLALDDVGAALGDAFATKAGPAFREQMSQFNQLAPEAQDIVRVHFTQKLLDMIENAAKLGGTKNLGELFTKAHTRNMIRELLGDEAAVRMARFVRDANTMAGSRDMMRGSQTHKRGQVQKEQDQDIDVVSAVENMDWRDWKASALQALRAAWRESRNKKLAKVLVTPMRDVPAVAQHLEQMKQARALAEKYARPAWSSLDELGKGQRLDDIARRRANLAGPPAAQIGNILSAYDNP